MAARPANAAKPAAEPSKPAEEKPKDIRSTLYSRAQTILRERHEDEFVDIITGLYAEAGLVYKRRLSPAEKAAAEKARTLEVAEKKLAALLEKHPDLADAIAARQGAQDTSEPVAG